MNWIWWNQFRRYFVRQENSFKDWQLPRLTIDKKCLSIKPQKGCILLARLPNYQ